MTQWLALAPAMSSFGPADDVFEYGFYEVAETGAQLVLHPSFQGDVEPGLTVDGKRLHVPPGQTIALRASKGTSWRVTHSDGELPPFVALASVAKPPSAGRDAGGDDVVVANELRVPTPADGDGGITLSLWQPDTPWDEDKARLASLAAACGEQTWSVSRGAGSARLDLGRCGVEVSDASRWIIAAGSGWATVHRAEGKWPRIGADMGSYAVLALLTLCGTLLLMAWLPVPGVVAAGVLQGLALLHPLAALGWWVLSLVLSVLWLGGRFCVRYPRRFLVVMAVAVVVVLVGLMGDDEEGHEGVKLHDASGPAKEPCLVTGYSTAGDRGLRQSRGGVAERLRSSCAVCRGAVTQRAWGGATFRQIRRHLCLSPPPRGTNVVFIGGGNDDYLWTAREVAPRLAYFYLSFLVDPGAGQRDWLPTLEWLSARSLERFDEQQIELRAALECAQRDDLRVVFVHDMTALDLEERSQARRTMLEARRRIVESAGARFIDLGAKVGPAVGVGWFNDMIHPSELGHERAAGLVCEAFKP